MYTFLSWAIRNIVNLPNGILLLIRTKILFFPVNTVMNAECQTGQFRCSEHNGSAMHV